jgi:flavin reductase (DIM6/NTAB) family NADH-FMN oxidoreductase RutF
MHKQQWKAGNMVYPLPAVMVSCGDREKQNILTIAWTGTVCTNPAMTYISVRPTRASYPMIRESGYFVINLTTKKLAYATDFCGVKSLREVDKFKKLHLTPSFDNLSGCPMIEECPVNIECKVTEVKELGSHHMFLAEVLAVYVDERYMDERGKFHLNHTDLIAYSHGAYFTLGEQLGTFGYSVKKEPGKKRENTKKRKK